MRPNQSRKRIVINLDYPKYNATYWQGEGRSIVFNHSLCSHGLAAKHYSGLRRGLAVR